MGLTQLAEMVTGPLPLAAAVVMVALGLVAEHYLLLGRVQWHRTWDYVAGVAAVLLPFSWWAGSHGYGLTVLAIWLLFGVGGAAVWGCYLGDGWLKAQEEARQAQRKAQTLEAHLRGQRDGRDG